MGWITVHFDSVCLLGKGECVEMLMMCGFSSSLASGPVSLPANPADISPEHLHDFLSMASSPPLPSYVQPPLGASTTFGESSSRASPDKLMPCPDGNDSGLQMAGSSDDFSPPSFAQASVAISPPTVCYDLCICLLRYACLLSHPTKCVQHFLC